MSTFSSRNRLVILVSSSESPSATQASTSHYEQSSSWAIFVNWAPVFGYLRSETQSRTEKVYYKDQPVSTWSQLGCDLEHQRRRVHEYYFSNRDLLLLPSNRFLARPDHKLFLISYLRRVNAGAGPNHLEHLVIGALSYFVEMQAWNIWFSDWQVLVCCCTNLSNHVAQIPNSFLTNLDCVACMHVVL